MWPPPSHTGVVHCAGDSRVQTTLSRRSSLFRTRKLLRRLPVRSGPDATCLAPCVRAALGVTRQLTRLPRGFALVATIPSEGKLPERVKGQVSFDDYLQLVATYCLFNREDMLMCTCACGDPGRSQAVCAARGHVLTQRHAMRPGAMRPGPQSAFKPLTRTLVA